MTWQATIAACAAQNLIPVPPSLPAPGADATVEWDSNKKVAAYVLSNGNRDVENTGVNNLAEAIIASKPIPPWVGRVYFEFVIVALGAATNDHAVGVVSDVGSHMYRVTAPTSNHNGGTLYRNNGEIFLGSEQWRTSLGSMPAGSVIGVVVDPGEGKIWYLRNNVLLGPSASLITGVPSGYFMAGNAVYPWAQCRDNGDKIRINTIPSEFTYPMPSGCKAYGSDLINFNDYYLNIDNDQFSLGVGVGSLVTPWLVDPAGSTMAIAGLSEPLMHYNNIRTDQNSVNLAYSWNPSFVRYIMHPNQSGFTWGTIYQDKVIDPRAAALIDNGDYVLRMQARITMKTGVNFDTTISNAAFVASFFDETDTLISSTETDKLARQRACLARRFFDVPPLTRKIRVGYKTFKPSAATSASGSFPNNSYYVRTLNKQASLHRKTGKLRAIGGQVSIILKPT